MESHDNIQPLLTDYVLGDLTPFERRRVESHLAGCVACAAEARELGLAFQSIGLQDEPVAPPAHLRSRVLKELGTRAGDPAARTTAPLRVHAGWLAAAAAIIVALGVFVAMGHRLNRDLTEQLSQRQVEAERLARQIATTESQADLVVAILTASDMKPIPLAGYDASRQTTARAYWSPSHGLMIVADQLPSPPQGRVYQAWLIGSASSGPVSAGIIDAPTTGRGILIVPTPRGVAGSVTIAVTDEPPGGLPSPTGGKHLVGS